MTENTFPVHKADAIVHFFRVQVLTGEEAKEFTKNDITPSPKPETVRLLYTRVLQLMYSFRSESHMVPFSENQQYSEHPEHHERSRAIFSVFLHMQQFLPMCFVYDFSLGDLLAPKTKRTLYILSGIMNFLHFRQQRMEMTMEYQARFRVDRDRLQALTNCIEEAEKKREILTTIPPEQQAEARELAAAIAELQTAYMRELQTVNGLKETIAERKTDIAKKSQKQTQMKVDVGTLKEDNGTLRAQIVESPEELKEQMERMKENVKNIKSAIERADERAVELQDRVQGVTHNEAEIQLMYKLLDDLHSGMNYCKQRQEEVQALAGQCEKQQKELKNMLVEEGQLRRALDMKQDKQSKQQIRRQKKREMKDHRVQDLMGQCDQVHQKREDMADQIQDVSRDSQQLKAKIQNTRDICSKETAMAQTMYDRLSTALDQFHKRIEKSIIEVKKDIHKMVSDPNV